MNCYILESAAIYANAYRANGGGTENQLREHIRTKFGETYAAIICR